MLGAPPVPRLCVFVLVGHVVPMVTGCAPRALTGDSIDVAIVVRTRHCRLAVSHSTSGALTPCQRRVGRLIP